MYLPKFLKKRKIQDKLYHDWLDIDSKIKKDIAYIWMEKHKIPAIEAELDEAKQEIHILINGLHGKKEEITHYDTLISRLIELLNHIQTKPEWESEINEGINQIIFEIIQLEENEKKHKLFVKHSKTIRERIKILYSWGLPEIEQRFKDGKSITQFLAINFSTCKKLKEITRNDSQYVFSQLLTLLCKIEPSQEKFDVITDLFTYATPKELMENLHYLIPNLNDEIEGTKLLLKLGRLVNDQVIFIDILKIDWFRENVPLFVGQKRNRLMFIVELLTKCTIQNPQDIAENFKRNRFFDIIFRKFIQTKDSELKMTGVLFISEKIKPNIQYSVMESLSQSIRTIVHENNERLKTLVSLTEKSYIVESRDLKYMCIPQLLVDIQSMESGGHVIHKFTISFEEKDDDFAPNWITTIVSDKLQRLHILAESMQKVDKKLGRVYFSIILRLMESIILDNRSDSDELFEQLCQIVLENMENIIYVDEKTVSYWGEKLSVLIGLLKGLLNKGIKITDADKMILRKKMAAVLGIDIIKLIRITSGGSYFIRQILIEIYVQKNERISFDEIVNLWTCQVS